MNKNFFDLTQVGKHQLETGKRIDRQAGEYMDNYYRNLRESKEAEEARLNEAALSSARLGYATTLERSKARVRNLRETIEYENNAAIVGMTEMISQVVEKALLLDEEEYAALNPDYREDIRDTVSGFLKEAEINDEITNRNTLKIMEFVSKTLPETKEGKNLTEDNLAALIRSSQTDDINGALNQFAGDVSKKVAVLMEKEQKKVKEIKADHAKAGVPEEQPQNQGQPAPANPDELVQALASGQMAPEELDAMVQQGQLTPEDAQAIMAQAQGQSQEQMPAEGMPQDGGMPMDQGMCGQPMPKKQIQMLPDGTMNINVFENENRFVRETPRCGLIESLAVNEATNMISEGKEYNPDLCLANAIMYVTITETMNAMGLMNIDDRAYNKVISHAGGKVLSEKSVYVNQLEKQQKIEKDSLAKKQKADLDAAKKSEKLTESVIAAQFVPQINRREPTDLAERLRAKRLNESKRETLDE